MNGEEKSNAGPKPKALRSNSDVKDTAVIENASSLELKRVIGRSLLAMSSDEDECHLTDITEEDESQDEEEEGSDAGRYRPHDADGNDTHQQNAVSTAEADAVATNAETVGDHHRGKCVNSVTHHVDSAANGAREDGAEADTGRDRTAFTGGDHGDVTQTLGHDAEMPPQYPSDSHGKSHNPMDGTRPRSVQSEDDQGADFEPAAGGHPEDTSGLPMTGQRVGLFDSDQARKHEETNVEFGMCNDADTSGYEPPWAAAVGEKGDVHYVEPQETVEGPQQPPQPGRHASHLHNGESVSALPATAKPKSKGSGRNHPRKRKDVQLVERKHGNAAATRNNKVTFNDHPTGVTREVALCVDPSRHNYGRRASLCETLFGIVPGYFSEERDERGGRDYADSRVMVQGLLPGGEACRAGIKIGEWLMMVDGEEVDFDNLDQILQSISQLQQVKLTLQKIAIQLSPRPALVRRNQPGTSSLVKLISGERVHEEPLNLSRLQHGAYYLTLDCSSENMQGKEDIVYQYPRQEGKLTDIRGVFTTLSHMLMDVTNNTARNSTLLVEEQIVHVGYSRENREVLVLAMPANRVPILQLNYILHDLVQLLKVMYGSLHSAFSLPGHHPQLDHLFSLVFHRTLLAEDLLNRGSKQTELLEPCTDSWPAVRVLTMPEETKVTMNNCLSQLEAADFADMSDDYYGLRRSYVVLGASLFYKGYLLANHLHREDLLDVVVYLRQHGLLTLCNEEQLGQLVVWREVFPTRLCHKAVDPIVPGYTEPEARWFLMVIGTRNAVLGTLLEAGGCAAWAEGCPTPDPFYVDQAKATLLQLEALDVFNQCEIRLQCPPVPSLTAVDCFLPLPKGASKDDLSGVGKVPSSPKVVTMPAPRKVIQPESILKKKTSASPVVESPRHGRGVVYEIESDLDSLSTGTSEGSVPNDDRRTRKVSAGSDESLDSYGSSSLFKGSKKRRNLPSVFDISELRRGLSRDSAAEEQDVGTLVKLTSGCDNTLFHYVQVECVEGLLLCPTQQELLQVTSDLHRQVLTHFHLACLSIREVLCQPDRVQKSLDNGNNARFGLDSALGQVTEHGLLFQCSAETWSDSRKSPPTVSYWVVGRKMQHPQPQEFYVCFHESVHQNLVEMAFKLGFGVSV